MEETEYEHHQGKQTLKYMYIGILRKEYMTIYSTIIQKAHYNKTMYISSVHNPFSDRVGLPHHNNSYPRVLVPFLPPGVNHTCGMQNQIVLNIPA